MNIFSASKVDIQQISIPGNCTLFMKREDQIHPQISGNKFWKLYYQLQKYQEESFENPLLITFGGAFSNHIAAVSYAGKLVGIKTVGIIRGEELTSAIHLNPTLSFAQSNGMEFRFVDRESYRDKEAISSNLKKALPNALVIPEGGTNELAVKGIQNMLGIETQDFDYLCSAVGTGGTLAGISKYCEENQKVIGYKVVKDSSLEQLVFSLSGRNNVQLIEPSERYGKITDENVRFINEFFHNYKIPLDPIYTGKMMQRLLRMIQAGGFPEGSRILAFHTGGLQGVDGANEMLKKQNRELIKLI